MKRKTIKLDSERFDGICGYVEDLNENAKRKPLLEFNDMITEADPEEAPTTDAPPAPPTEGQPAEEVPTEPQGEEQP